MQLLQLFSVECFGEGPFARAFLLRSRGIELLKEQLRFTADSTVWKPLRDLFDGLTDRIHRLGPHHFESFDSVELLGDRVDCCCAQNVISSLSGIVLLHFLNLAVDRRRSEAHVTS